MKADITTAGATFITTGGSISAVVDLFAQAQDVARTTRDLYTRTLNAFFTWVNCTGRSVQELSISDLIAYKDGLFSCGKSSLTVASYINSVRRFYEWTEANKIYPNIGKGLHAPKRKQAFRKQPLTVEQVGKLLRHESAGSLRDYAIVNLLARTGLRCIEVARANIGDISYLGGRRVLYVQGKGREEKDNFVLLTDAAYKPIADYLEQRGERDPKAPLFASTSNHTADAGKHDGEKDFNPRRMTTRAISSIARKGLDAVGLTDRVYTTHSLRHTAAVNVLRAGGTLEQVQFMLRHSNPATTQIYTATIREEQRIKNSGEQLLDGLYRGAF